MKWSKENCEEHVIECFCKHLGPGSKLIKKREEPDGVIEVKGRHIGVELTQLRRQGSYNSAVRHNEDLIKYITDHWIDDPEVNRCSLSLDFIEKNNRNNDSTSFVLPEPREQESFVNELKRLAIKYIPQTKSMLEVVFKPNSKIKKYRHVDKVREYIASEDYPIASKCCSKVRLHPHSDCQAGRPSTNIDSGYVGIDQSELQTIIRKKLKKVSTYRSNLEDSEVGSIPIWLLVYNEGNSIASRIKNPKTGENGRITDIIRDVLNNSGGTDKFDEIWYGKDLVMQGSSPREFWRVYP